MLDVSLPRSEVVLADEFRSTKVSGLSTVVEVRNNNLKIVGEHWQSDFFVLLSGDEIFQ